MRTNKKHCLVMWQGADRKQTMFYLLKKIPLAIAYRFKRYLVKAGLWAIFIACRFLPLQDKIVGSNFSGKRYGDNTKEIFEELMQIAPKQMIYVWQGSRDYSYELPTNVKRVDRENIFQLAYEYATAKVWIDTHVLLPDIRKRKGQLYIETWHGGLGIKKIYMDSEEQSQYKNMQASILHMNKLADLYISNSEHLSNVYRCALGYKGPIWKIGYPKNDRIIQNDHDKYAAKIRKVYGIPDTQRILIYAPSFRDCFEHGIINTKPYGIDYSALREALFERTGDQWVILLRWHPVMQLAMKSFAAENAESVVDVTEYPDIEDLILSADACISDYSSCIFDAALRNIPCFTFATDFEEYKSERGVYYDMEELPFPYARNNDELMENIRSFDQEAYLKRWEAFKVRTGLYETGHAGKDIAALINEYIRGNRKPLEEIQNES